MMRPGRASRIPTRRLFRRYWPADLRHEDIIRFHAVYWPAFLMSTGIGCREGSSRTVLTHNRGEDGKSVGVGPVCPGGGARGGSGPLLPAGGPFGPGRQYSLTGHRHSDQHRSGHTSSATAPTLRCRGNLDGRVPNPEDSQTPTPRCFATADGSLGSARSLCTGDAPGAGGDLADARRREQKYFSVQQPWVLRKRAVNIGHFASSRTLLHLLPVNTCRVGRQEFDSDTEADTSRSLWVTPVCRHNHSIQPAIRVDYSTALTVLRVIG